MLSVHFLCNIYSDNAWTYKQNASVLTITIIRFSLKSFKDYITHFWLILSSWSITGFQSSKLVRKGGKPFTNFDVNTGYRETALNLFRVHLYLTVLFVTSIRICAGPPVFLEDLDFVWFKAFNRFERQESYGLWG